jgi:hypothetical protein
MKHRSASIQRKKDYTKDTKSGGENGAGRERSPASGEAERVVIRVLKRLAGGQTWLRRLDADGVCFGLYSPRKAFAEAEVTVSGRQVAEWLARDWLEPADGGGERLKLSAAGLGWLRRRLSSGDAFQEQHRAVRERAMEVEGVSRSVLVNDAESPLTWLRRRKDRNGEPLIAAWQFEAGERLRADFGRGMMQAHVTANWEGAAPSSRRRRLGGGGSAGVHDCVMDARRRVRQALVAVGPELASVVFDVCCCLKGLEEEEECQGWPRRSGKVVLQIGLTRLARHYGLLAREDIPGTVRRRLLHWGAEDYRPAVDG